jgi:hypothetical protein
MSIIAPILSAVNALVVTAITLAVVAPVVVASVIVVVVAVVISSIPVIIAAIGPAVTIMTLITVLVVVVAGLGLHGVGRYSKGTVQLLALSHFMFGVTVELALVVHDHDEIAFEEGGGSWWIGHVSFTRSLMRPVSFVVVIFSVEVMHHRFLSVD